MYAGLAKGSGPLQPPAPAGYLIGSSVRYLVVEAHISNPGYLAGVSVTDLLRVYTASQLRPHNAANMALGDVITSARSIPAGMDQVTVRVKYTYSVYHTCVKYNDKIIWITVYVSVSVFIYLWIGILFYILFLKVLNYISIISDTLRIYVYSRLHQQIRGSNHCVRLLFTYAFVRPVHVELPL